MRNQPLQTPYIRFISHLIIALNPMLLLIVKNQIFSHKAPTKNTTTTLNSLIKPNSNKTYDPLFNYYNVKGSFGTNINDTGISNIGLIVQELIMQGLFLPSVWFNVSHIILCLE